MRSLTRALSAGARTAALAHRLPVAGRAARFASNLLLSCATNSLTLTELRRGIREHWEVLVDLEGDAVQGLCDWETTITERWTRPGTHVLVAGCGSGREILALAAKGCRVTGIDPVAAALAVARRTLKERSFSADLIEGFVEETKPPGQFDVIWFSGACYSLIPEATRRVRTLGRLTSQLRPGGSVFVDYQFPLHRPKPVVIQASRLAGALAGSDWRMEPGDRIGFAQRGAEVFFSYGHAFTSEEFEREAAEAGLRIVHREHPHDWAAYVLQPTDKSRQD